MSSSTSSTTAYQQLAQWDQQWQTTEMAQPIVPLDNTDAANNGIEKPGALGGFTLPQEASVNLPKVANADTDVGPADAGENVHSPGLNVFA